MPIITKQIAKDAADYLAQADAALAPVIAQAGLTTIAPHNDYYGALVNSIIGQQLSVKAAASIQARFQELFDDQLPSPEQILTKTHDELRAVGLSNAKVNYIQDLAEHVLDGRLSFDQIDAQTNDQIIAELTNVKGIGEWTAHMFLMFSMARSDVLPTGDLGIRNGVRALYGFENVPTPEEIKEVAETNKWHPYESIACWYIWHSLDNEPV